MLPKEFFDRDTVTVARELVGKYLIRRYDGVTLAARIVETEAYVGRVDKACPPMAAAERSGRKRCSARRGRPMST